MLATDFKLIPLSALCKHEETVRSRLPLLPFSYSNSLLDEPEIRYPFLYYALLTHWPELLGDFAEDELLYNRLYWFMRLSHPFRRQHGFDAGLEQQAPILLEAAMIEFGAEGVSEIDARVRREWENHELEIAVSFSSYSIGKVKDQLDVQLHEVGDYFVHTAPVVVSSLVLETLKKSVPLALKINTEKARSEMIVTPILLEVHQQLDGAISLFSGVDWEVDSARGLRGRCDFLMALSPEQLRIEAPVLTIVEVKNDDTAAGIAQCLAEMVAARIFNQQHGHVIPTIFGIVTTGNVWKFLRLIDSTAYLDESEYYINDVERIVGIIVSMFASLGVVKKT